MWRTGREIIFRMLNGCKSALSCLQPQLKILQVSNYMQKWIEGYKLLPVIK